ncbi:methylated-DNA--[protein]-cysteine S-methyltransferase [Sphingomonas cavernae]|uniref:methylated-DNA--[protein]-cysteine S-methyltransferase n=1 Tax=Sphingomonas cavernae TaxID=2320861 RepID=A0A418W814_9SPHN|nr:methylated-DNA--[protein]-cysteine S-methyltransferase [Sphingomonas cavernae]RJF86143.1 methylated-DNA--[protein]-cysteine S-methyltransferase [Sphingomonas cavernae]
MDGPRLTHDRISTCFGELVLVSDEEGVLRALSLPGRDSWLEGSLRRQYGTNVSREGKAPAAIKAALADYCDGDMSALSRIRWTTRGTALQQRVWDALYAIPVGETTSYAALAASIGSPDAVRAVGAANGANPVAIVVPCHRVVGSDGSLTGFGGGLPMKMALLRHEGANVAELRTRDLFD